MSSRRRYLINLLRARGLKATGTIAEMTDLLIESVRKEISEFAGKTIHGITFERKLGEGTEGIVFAGKVDDVERPVAVKVSPLGVGLEKEYLILEKFYENDIPVPIPYCKMTLPTYSLIIMEKLSYNLEQVLECNNGRFTSQECDAIAQRIIPLLYQIHVLGYLYVDIKPQNILIDDIGDPSEQKLYFVDFGSVIRKNSGPNRLHIGTPRYTSIDAHLGRPLSPRHDLQSLGYLLLSFYHGQLPWDDQDKCRPLGFPHDIDLPFEQYLIGMTLMKEKLTVDDLMSTPFINTFSDNDDLRNEERNSEYPRLRKYLEYVFSLKVNEEPDYSYLLSIFFSD
jgi:serine/threonine protein kinase